MDVDSPGDLTIPVDRVRQDTARERMCDPDTIAEVLVWLAQRHLMTAFPTVEGGTPSPVTAEGLLAVEDRQKASRPRGYMPNPFELSPLYELRYAKALRITERGVVGSVTMNNLKSQVSYQYKLCLEQVQAEQPNGDWRLVAALPRQITTKALLRAPIGSIAEEGRRGVGSMVHDMLSIRNYDKPPMIPVEQQYKFQDTTDLRWEMPLVFCDVARAELVDPHTLQGDGIPNKQMEQYVETHQFRYLTAGQRRQRKLCEDAVREFFAKRGELASMPKQLDPPKLSQTQLMIAEKLRSEGTSPAMIAGLLGVELEDLTVELDRLVASRG